MASSRATASLVLVATFTLGVIAGGALLHMARLAIDRPPLPPPDGPRAPGGPPGAHLVRELGLDPEQAERLRGILEESRGRLHDEAEATRERIREILTPEQRRRFDAMRRPPPFPPPGRPGLRRGPRPPI